MGAVGEPSRLEPGAPLVNRPFLKITSTSIITLPVTALTKYAGHASDAAVARLLAVVILWFAVLYTARFVTHLELHYGRWTTPLNKVMYVVLGIEGLICLAFLACGPLLFFTSTRSSQLGALEFEWALGLWAVILIHSLILSWLVEELKLPRGSENAHRCRIVKILAGGAKRLNLQWLSERLMRKTQLDQVSALIIWTLAGVAGVMAANAPAFAPDAYKILNGTESHSVGKRPDGKTSGKPPPAKTPRHRRREPVSSAVGRSTSEPGQTPDYGALCGAALQPGDGAPEPQRSELFAQWLARGQGLGAIFAGCANPAHAVGTNGIWISAGTCEGALRSLAVASTDGPGAILLWGPARFALAQANAGSLLGATPHRLAENGDIYTVATITGTYVFLRRELSNGHERPAGVARSCRDVREDPVPFLEVPPALTRLWIAEMENDGRWLWPVLSLRSRTGLDFGFRSVDPADNRRITASCSSDTSCVLRVDDVESRTDGAGNVDASKLLNLAPPTPVPPAP
jgi:hypothetical protein